MVLYFPVSALVTLFGNILQNPLDPRARSDTRLMNVVVSFLSMLGHEAETGGVHRILGVCSEFERIAKVVIDKTEKEHSSRRKRKNNDQSSKSNSSNNAGSPSFNPNATVSTPRPPTASSATPQPSHNTNGHLSPGMKDHRSPPGGYSPMPTSMSQSPSPGMAPKNWAGDFTVDGSDGAEYASFADLAGYSGMAALNGIPPGGLTSPPLGPPGIFQQPMLPQDLFSLPMTLDWDWAEMSGGAYPSVENGNFEPQGR